MTISSIWVWKFLRTLENEDNIKANSSIIIYTLSLFISGRGGLEGPLKVPS